ncbi:MAG: hypothetical protein J0M12_05365 [Deltaproteobacteria bacterium]|nr:hypothetical protein [Deltaproteobacteria bacterium]
MTRPISLSFICAVLALALSTTSPMRCMAEDEKASFLPTWKLLNPQEKQQFMAGYLYGWRDAAKVTDIAISYIKENPQKAVEGLESVRALYDVSRFNSSAIAHEVDTFFQDSDNHDASLTAAISFAKARLR